jgi:plastocyanin
MRSTRILFAAALLAQTLNLSCGGTAGYSPSPMTPTPTPAPTPGPIVSADVVIVINGMNGSQSFSPSPGSVKAGQTVAWRNADLISHTASADGGAFDTGVVAPGSTSAAIRVTATGSFGYHCQIHPSMVGTLNVIP